MEQLQNNRDLLLILKNKNAGFNNYKELLSVIVSRLPVTISESVYRDLESSLRLFCMTLHSKWVKRNYKIDYFESSESSWLDRNFCWPSSFLNEITLQEPCTTQQQKSGERAKKPFDELCLKQKKRRTENLISHSSEELAFAMKLKLQMDGNRQLSKIFNYLLENPDEVKRVSDFLFSPSKNQKTVQVETSLALMTSLKLSTWQYRTLQQFTNKHMEMAKLPSYYKIQQEKEKCYPSKEDVFVTEKMAEIKLQSILDLTVKRILKIPNIDTSQKSLTLTSKWGFDGASSQSGYKQKYENSKTSEQDDSSVFMTSLVPLKLFTADKVIWENPSPSSTRYCRPIKFHFVKETKDIVKQEFSNIQSQINKLLVTTCDHDICVRHDLHMTMIDGKIRTIISDTTSSSTCPICLTKPSDMNNLQTVFDKPNRKDIYKYGLSTLHMWIRCMECLLHISYNLEFKKWVAKGEDKVIKDARKKKNSG